MGTVVASAGPAVIRVAAGTFDLGQVFAVLATYRRMLDQVAHAIRSGEAPPGSIEAAEMRARLEQRLRH